MYYYPLNKKTNNNILYWHYTSEESNQTRLCDKNKCYEVLNGFILIPWKQASLDLSTRLQKSECNKPATLNLYNHPLHGCEGIQKHVTNDASCIAGLLNVFPTKVRRLVMTRKSII